MPETSSLNYLLNGLLKNKGDGNFFQKNPSHYCPSMAKNRYLTELELISLSELSWSHINIDKNFFFDYSIDTSELLFDKACASPAPYWTQKYDPRGFKIHHNQNKPKTRNQSYT